MKYKITNLSKREMNKIVKKVTANSQYKWYCKIDENNNSIMVGNDYFSENEFFVIENSEEDYVGIKLNYIDEKIMGIIIDPSFAFADFNEWCLGAFESLVKKCLSYFEYYV